MFVSKLVTVHLFLLNLIAFWLHSNFSTREDRAQLLFFHLDCLKFCLIFNKGTSGCVLLQELEQLTVCGIIVEADPCLGSISVGRV